MKNGHPGASIADNSPSLTYPVPLPPEPPQVSNLGMVFKEVAKSVRIAADFVAVLSTLIVKSLNYLCGSFLNMNLVRA